MKPTTYCQRRKNAQYQTGQINLYENPGGSGICEYSFRALHYKISAVDITSLESLKSEKDVITGYIDPCAPEDRPMPDMGTPKEFALNQNYPNPFNPTTNIQYDIPNDVFVSIKVYDMLGREVSELVNEVKNAEDILLDLTVRTLHQGSIITRSKQVILSRREGWYLLSSQLSIVNRQ